MSSLPPVSHKKDIVVASGLVASVACAGGASLVAVVVSCCACSVAPIAMLVVLGWAAGAGSFGFELCVSI